MKNNKYTLHKSARRFADELLHVDLGNLMRQVYLEYDDRGKRI